MGLSPHACPDKRARTAKDRLVTRPNITTNCLEGSGEVQGSESNWRGYKSDAVVMQTTEKGANLHPARDGRHSLQDNMACFVSQLPGWSVPIEAEATSGFSGRTQ